MKNFIYYLTTFSFGLVLGLFVISINAQTKEPIATKVTIKNPSKYTKAGELYITVGGKQQKIAESAKLALIINNGKDVVYSSFDGAGGYENEGQSIRIYDVRSKSTRKILSQYYMVDAMAEKKLSNGETALLVRMSDGGLGASSFAVVNPNSGTVFSRSFGELLNISGDTITLGIYLYEDWEEINQQRDLETGIIPTLTKIKPEKKEIYDLKKLLNNEVIYIEHSSLFTLEREKLKEVKVYYWRVNDYIPDNKLETAPVPRYVNPKAPLRPALEALFAGPNKDEEENGFGSPTFALNFEGVTLKNGTATVKFSQSPDKRNHGSSAPFIFEEAVRRTALQFPTVKKVEICGIGDTFIDEPLDKPFARCSK